MTKYLLRCLTQKTGDENLDKKKQKHFEEILNEQKSEREKSLFDDKLGLHAELREVTSELSSYDNHPGDLGTETFEAEKNISLRNNDKYALSEIEDAVSRIHKGKYGKCEACGNEIVEERLELIPYTRYCVTCEEEKEKTHISYENGRPMEEQALYPPFGRTDTDCSVNNEVMFDGEDTWEAVESFNLIDSPEDNIDDLGYVEEIEKISNQQYKQTLE